MSDPDRSGEDLRSGGAGEALQIVSGETQHVVQVGADASIAARRVVERHPLAQAEAFVALQIPVLPLEPVQPPAVEHRPVCLDGPARADPAARDAESASPRGEQSSAGAPFTDEAAASRFAERIARLRETNSAIRRDVQRMGATRGSTG